MTCIKGVSWRSAAAEPSSSDGMIMSGLKSCLVPKHVSII